MLSSTKHKINLGPFSISSSSSTSSSSSSSSTSTSTSSSSLGQNRSQVTMEEVWKEINLGSLHHHRQLNTQESMLKNQNPNNSIFHDFLNMPLNQQQPPPPSSSSIVTALYGSPLPLPSSVTVLTLNSGVGFEFLDNTDTLVASNPHFFKESANFGCFGKKRGQDSDQSGGDRRHKRMIKNRESAARSRARKQAYTNELVLEVAHLQTENARLKREQEELKMAEATTRHRVKKTLQRSSTAPF